MQKYMCWYGWPVEHCSQQDAAGRHVIVLGFDFKEEMLLAKVQTEVHTFLGLSSNDYHSLNACEVILYGRPYCALLLYSRPLVAHNINKLRWMIWLRGDPANITFSVIQYLNC